MKTFSVYFISGRDGYPNHKLLEATEERYVREFMEHAGHEIIEIVEVA